jgi:hypothetical protein
MKQTQKQLKKEIDYFEKMKKTILEDIKDGRDASSLAGSIGRPLEILCKYMKEWGIKDLYGVPLDIVPHEHRYFSSSRKREDKCLICDKPLYEITE